MRMRCAATPLRRRHGVVSGAVRLLLDGLHDGVGEFDELATRCRLKWSAIPFTPATRTAASRRWPVVGTSSSPLRAPPLLTAARRGLPHTARTRGDEAVWVVSVIESAGIEALRVEQQPHAEGTPRSGRGLIDRTT